MTRQLFFCVTLLFLLTVSAQAESKKALHEFNLLISNQSFVISPVDITVKIDGEVVIQDSLEVKNQHYCKNYPLTLSEGKHTIEFSSRNGNAALRKDFILRKKMWAYASYCYDLKPGLEHKLFVLAFSNDPIGID